MSLMYVWKTQVFMSLLLILTFIINVPKLVN